MTTDTIKTSLGQKIRIIFYLTRAVLRVYSRHYAGRAAVYLSNIRDCQRNGRSLEAYKRGLENILAEVKRHDAHLDDEAHGGENAIPPGGDDYSEITVKLTVLAESALREATDRKVKRFRIIHKERS